jgi:ABC-type transport system substrate-binding protein
MRTIRRREAMKLLTAGAAAIVAPNIARAETKPVRIRRRTEFFSFDPAFCRNFEDEVIAAAILAPLLRYKARTNGRWDTEPHLAAKCTVAPTGMDYAFDLRGETWKDIGSAVTPDDVAFSFERLKDLPNGWAVRDIANTQPPSSNGVDVKLRSPVEAFDTMFLATGYAAILPKSKLGGLESVDFRFAPPDHSGAYDIVGGGRNPLLLAANQNWAGTKPGIDRIEFVVIPKEEDARSLRDRGEIDVSEVPRDLTAAGRDPPDGWRVSSETTGRIVYLTLFPNGPLLRSPDARRGVQLSIEREALVRTVYGEQWAQQASSIAPSGWVWTSEGGATVPGDAAALLHELRGARLTLAFTQNHFPDPSALEEVASFVADSVRKQGVEVDVSSIEAERLFGGGNVNLEKLDMLVTRAPVWRLGVRDALARFSNAHSIGSNEINDMNARAQKEPSSELLRAIESRLIEMGALRVLAEERAVWGYDRSIIPFFGPEGGIANLVSWKRA